jgi:YD repeat-containing protein
MKVTSCQSILRAAALGMLALVLSTHVYAQKTAYYRHLVFRESPFSDTKGIHPIDKQTAENETHYRFEYDGQDRLIEVSHRIGDFIINDNSNWDSFIWFGAKMTVEYAENRETRYYYNRLDQRIEAHGKMYKAVFDLDNEGQRTAVKFYDEDNNPSENAWNIHSYQWTDLGAGNILEKRFNLKNEPQPIRPNFTFYTVRLAYGEDDVLDFVHHLDENGERINNSMKAGMDRIVYDQEGNFSRWMVFDKDLKPVEGNAPEFAIGEHLYDARGNKVELRGFDVIGRFKAMPTGVARVLNTYDKYNNQVEVKMLDLQGNTMQHVKREYSEDGRRIEWIKYLDENGNLSMPEGAPFAAIQFEYAEDGSMAGRKRFDLDLKEIK